MCDQSNTKGERGGPLGPLGFACSQHRQTLRPTVDGTRSKALRPGENVHHGPLGPLGTFQAAATFENSTFGRGQFGIFGGAKYENAVRERQEMNKNDGHLPAVGQSSTDKFRQERREKAAREKEEADRQKLVRTRLPSAPLVKRCGLRPRHWKFDGRICCCGRFFHFRTGGFGFWSL